eukprot:GEMP01005466.1.p1 GENE.GEMP01005466.1~~GEMP01005466.1.p1  ORF type:complete len:478 (+),score=100.52 GEMP01005466.1:44-1477(+)
MASQPLPVVDKSRIQGFGSNGPGPASEEPPGIFSRVSVSPGVQSAMDTVTLSVGDAVERTTDVIADSIDTLGGWISSSLWRRSSTSSKNTEATKSNEDTEGNALVGDHGDDADATATQKEGWGSTEQVINELCAIRGTRVVPTISQLDYFCDRVSGLRLSEVTKEISSQLSYSAGDTQWQPRLRVLYGLQAIHENGMNVVFTKIMREVHELVTSLLNEPECAEIAQQVLDLQKVPAVPPTGPEDAARRRRQRRRQESTKAEAVEDALVQLDEPAPAQAPTSMNQTQELLGLSSAAPAATQGGSDFLGSGLNLGCAAVSSTAYAPTVPSPAPRFAPLNSGNINEIALHSFASFPHAAAVRSASFTAPLPSAQSAYALHSRSDLPSDLLDVHAGNAFATRSDGVPTGVGFGRSAPANTSWNTAFRTSAPAVFTSAHVGPSDRLNRFSALSSSLEKGHQSSLATPDHFGFVNDLFDKPNL